MTFRNILERLNLLINKEKRAKVFGNQEGDNDEGIKKFRYLLTVLDAIEGRKLPCTGQMYSCILSQGATLGGLYRKISSLIQTQRTESLHINVDTGHDNEETAQEINLMKWSDLLENYSEYKTAIQQRKVKFPLVRVRINQRDIRQVLFAEQGVTYGGGRRVKTKFAKSRR